MYKNFCFLYHLCKIANNQSVTSDTKKSLFVSFAKTTCPACKKAQQGDRWQGRTKGEQREGEQSEQSEQSEMAKNGEIVPQNFHQRKSFLGDAVIRNYLLQKMLYLRPMVRDGQQERSRGAQAAAKGHQPAGQRRRLQKRISAAQQMGAAGQAEKWPKNRFLIRMELRKCR